MVHTKKVVHTRWKKGGPARPQVVPAGTAVSDGHPATRVLTQVEAEAEVEKDKLKEQLEDMQKELNTILNDRYNLQHAMRAAMKEYGTVAETHRERPPSASGTRPTSAQHNLMF